MGKLESKEPESLELLLSRRIIEILSQTYPLEPTPKREAEPIIYPPSATPPSAINLEKCKARARLFVQRLLDKCYESTTRKYHPPLFWEDILHLSVPISELRQALEPDYFKRLSIPTKLVEAAEKEERNVDCIENIIQSMDEITLTSLALYLPVFYGPDSSAEYIQTAKILINAKITIFEIENYPEEYFNLRTRNLDENSRKLYNLISKEVLSSDVTDSKKDSHLALRSYGHHRFFAENLAVGKSLASAFYDNEAMFQQRAYAAFLDRLLEGYGHITASEEREISSCFEEEQKKAFKEYEQGAIALKAMPKMLNAILITAAKD